MELVRGSVKPQANLTTYFIPTPSVCPNTRGSLLKIVLYRWYLLAVPIMQLTVSALRCVYGPQRTSRELQTTYQTAVFASVTRFALDRGLLPRPAYLRAMIILLSLIESMIPRTLKINRAYQLYPGASASD